MSNETYMAAAIEEAVKGVHLGHGGPFGAVIVKGEVIISRAHNHVLANNDPTAHAEVMAIRQACQHLQDFSLKGCVLYTSCQPCPMCLSAIHWARLDRYYFAAYSQHAAQAAFDDSLLYDLFLEPDVVASSNGFHLPIPNVEEPFIAWNNKADRIPF